MRILATLTILIAIIFTFGCKNKPSNEKLTESKTKPDSYYIEKGKEIASSSFIALSGKLKKAMKKGGVPQALQYCNTNALPLTDSLSQKYNATIKRTSLKYRNPNNKPTTKEEEVLIAYESSHKNKELLTPQIEYSDGVPTFHAPILVQGACLKCHGSKDDIPNYNKIQSLYPTDLATEYQLGDLRGMWSITFTNL